MNGTLLYYLGSSLAVLHYLSVVTSIEAQQNVFTADGILQGKRKELDRFVEAAQANSQGRCSALKTCSSEPCSRSACYQYGKVGDSNYQCVKVFNNTALCGQQSCALRNFDYSRSFVRRVDVSNDTDNTVCIQRSLDDEFKHSSMNDSTHFFRVFFGATDGTTRIYPGADEYCTEPRSTFTYDPRGRPWYKQSTSVPKVVSIVLDSGPSMINPRIVDTDDKYLDKGITMVRTFLGTLTDDIDYVTVTCFDGDGALKSPNIVATKYNTSQHYEPINEFLANIRRNSTNVVKPSSVVDVRRAINSSIIQLNSASFPPTYLKVVIVLTTAGSFESKLSNLDIPANSGVNVFVYSFNSDSQKTECNATVGAFSEKIPSTRLDNPLYALESYYSFVAKVYRNFYGAGSFDYSPRYSDHSGVDNNTLTLSQAASDKNGELLGVVGIDIFEFKFGEQFAHYEITFQDIVDVAQASLNSATFNVSKVDTSKFVCFNPYSLTENCTTPVRGLQYCGADTNKDTSVGCCVNCTSTHAGPDWPKIGGSVAGGFLGLVVIAAIVFYTWRCVARRIALDHAPFVMPVGPPVGAVEPQVILPERTKLEKLPHEGSGMRSAHEMTS